MYQIFKGFSFNIIDIIKLQDQVFKINVVRVMLVHFFIYLVLPFQSIYMINLGLSPIQLGWVTGFAGIIGGIFSFISAQRISVTFSLKTFFLITTLSIGLGSMILSIANNSILAALGAGVFIFSWYSMMHLCGSVCGLCLNNDIRVTAMQTCDMLASIPKLLAPALGSFLAITFSRNHDMTTGIPLLYLISTLGFFIIFILLLKYFSNPSSLCTDSVVQMKYKNDRYFRKNVRDLLSQKNGINIKCLLLTLILIQIPWFIMNIYMPLFAQQVKNADTLTIGFMQSAFWACTLLLAIPAGSIADKIGRKSSLTIFLSIAIFSLILLILSKTQQMLIVSGFLQGFTFLSLVTSSGMSIEAVPKTSLIKWLGFQGLLKGLMAQLGPAMGGTLWGVYGPYSLIYLIIGFYIIAIVLLRTLPETKEGILNYSSESLSAC
ncbi:MAG: MFS transporter [Eubacteriaceae bacterium]